LTYFWWTEEEKPRERSVALTTRLKPLDCEVGGVSVDVSREKSPMGEAAASVAKPSMVEKCILSGVLKMRYYANNVIVIQE
jgi:hypothetical protein